MTETDATGIADASHDAWSRMLDELEAELGDILVPTGSATGVPADSTTGWTPPVDLGPLPPELEIRARELLAGQRELIAELEHARRATAAQLNVLRKMPATRPARASVYLDTLG
jgi:hypothetical protein